MEGMEITVLQRGPVVLAFGGSAESSYIKQDASGDFICHKLNLGEEEVELFAEACRLHPELSGIVQKLVKEVIRIERS
jgi:hypothetical protein